MFNEKVTRELAKYFITVLVDEVGRRVMNARGERTGPSKVKLKTDETEVNLSLHLDKPQKQREE